MPTATLTFMLPEEEIAFNDAMNGARWHGIVFDFDEYLRRRLKYEDLPEAVDMSVECARTTLRDLIADENLEL